MACHSEGRLREPLLLYALQSDRFPEPMAMTDDSELRGEYGHAADPLGELAPKTMRWSTATTLPPVTVPEGVELLLCRLAQAGDSCPLEIHQKGCLSSRETGEGCACRANLP